MIASGRVILITGTSRGIGRYLAEHYLAQGDRVIGCSRGETDLVHERYRHYQLDVSDEEAVCQLFREVRRAGEGLHVLINNAALATMNHFLLTAASTVEKILSANVLGTFLCCREAAKIMQRSRSGRIVNFGSVATPLNLEGEAIYAASKAAVMSLTKILARELAEFHITVNGVGPSPVRTDMTNPVPDKTMRALLERQALPRYASYDDVANVIDFFIRPQSSFVTGQVLYLGGV